MKDKYNLLRFIEAQETYGIYEIAVGELERGRKRSHWIWFVFPQLKGLGYSYNSNFYGITCREEAEAYLTHELLNYWVALMPRKCYRALHFLMQYRPMISLRNVWRFAIGARGMLEAWKCFLHKIREQSA